MSSKYFDVAIPFDIWSDVIGELQRLPNWSTWLERIGNVPLTPVPLLGERISELEAENKQLKDDKRILHAQFVTKGYIPQDIASECLEMLSPLEVKGEPNTLWALVRKAMSTIKELENKSDKALKVISSLRSCSDDDGDDCWCIESPTGDNYDKRGITKHEPRCIDIRYLLKGTVFEEPKLEFARPGTPWCWLTWAMRENGIVELRAVSLTSSHAEYSRKSLRHEDEFGIYKTNPLVRVWSEKRWAEHIYGLTGSGANTSDEVIQEIGKEDSPQFKEFLATQYSKMRSKMLAQEGRIKELEEQLNKPR